MSGQETDSVFPKMINGFVQSMNGQSLTECFFISMRIRPRRHEIPGGNVKIQTRENRLLRHLDHLISLTSR